MSQRLNEAKDKDGSTVMKQTAGYGVFAIVFIMLALELFGAGAYLVTSAHADPSDFCFGYAICR